MTDDILCMNLYKRDVYKSAVSIQGACSTGCCLSSNSENFSGQLGSECDYFYAVSVCRGDVGHHINDLSYNLENLFFDQISRSAPLNTR